MATSRKTPSKTTTAKATAAGPKRRAGGKRAAAADPNAEAAASPPADARPHLRAVETAAPAPAAKTKAKAETATTTDGADASGSDPRFKRADLIEAVAERTALKKSDAKLVLDLVLEELGRALDRTDDLILPPLGKLSVKRRKPDADGPGILTLKLRRPGSGASKGDESPLADPDEDG
ncbi:HU family DNA-binding protein [Roseicyclus mahoneyensis]|uniref:DNA-binding protein n=1 Tax=Roseicyclus mahoneyensis TaxID=164332 RepID=A0A316GPD6_9RHOB|nr:HU family DNA-binding protein [Roseicyclus mahoneyensis]PWK62744.1 DNA-binding protein [Roseicyclus mahoneyensis]